MENIIETYALTKKYGAKAAVNAVSIQVKIGDIYGLIGKNGAGKTSLMKLLLGLTKPNSGQMRLFGGDDLEAARHRIGSLVESPALYKNESAFENMKRFAILSPTSDDEIHRLLTLVGLDNVGKKKAGEFSLGMRQRLGLAIALLGKPELLILDEPINGLDPAGIKDIRDIILRLHEQGVTFVISSHLLDELGKIATNYAILANGELVEQITAAQLEQRCRTGIKLTVGDRDAALRVIGECFPDARTERAGESLRVYGGVSDASQLAEMLVKNGVRLYELRGESQGFEDYFIERLGR